MNNILGFGKYLFILTINVFGVMHFSAADQLAGMAPGGVVMVYITGIALIAAAVSVLIGKFDKLATFLLGILLLLFIIPHAQLLSEDASQMSNILKNLSMAGGAFMYASAFAKDKTYVN